MLLTKEVTVNLGYRESGVVLDGMQGDSGRGLKFHFTEGDNPWTIPENVRIMLQYSCEDGTGGTYDTLSDGTPAYEIGQDNSLTVKLISQLFGVAGITKLQVTLLSDTAQISTFPVVIRVAPGVTGEASRGQYVNLQNWLLDAIHRDPFVAAILGVLPDGDEVKY